MDEIRREIGKARGRLNLQRYLSSAAVWTTIFLVLAVVALFVPRAIALSADGATLFGVSRLVWDVSWLGGAVVLGLMAAGISVAVRGADDRRAAVEIDARLGLRERVASTLYLSPAELETHMGEALVADATRALRRVDVPQAFGVRTSWQAAMPVVLALAAFVGAFLLPVLQREPQAAATEETPEEQEQIRRSTEVLRRRVAEQRKEASQQDLKEAEELFTKIEEGLEKLADSKADRKQAMVELSDLADQVKKRRQELNSAEEMRKQLEQLKQGERGPAEQLSKAVQEGNFAAAQQELSKLQQQLQQGDMSQDQLEQLAQQMEAMANQMNKAIEAHKQAVENLQQQIEQQQAAGNREQAEKLQEQLSQLEQNSEAMNRLQQMCDALGGACENCRSGNGEGAASQLAELSAELGQLADQISEMQTLDGTLDEIADAKQAMQCEECEGGNAMPGSGRDGQDGANRKPQGQQFAGGGGLKPGTAPGGRIGDERQENPNEANSKLYDSQVAGDPKGGAATIVDRVHGPNVAGQARQQVQAEVSAAGSDRSDPLVGHRLPRAERDHVQQYFDSLREGESED